MIAFSCRSRSRATLSKAANRCLPCRSEGSARRKSQSQVRGEEVGRNEVQGEGLGDRPAPSGADPASLAPATPVPCHRICSTDRPEPGTAALALTSRALCLQHLMPLLECILAPRRLLPHAPVLAAQAVSANMGWGPGAAHCPPALTDPGLQEVAGRGPEKSRGSSQCFGKLEPGPCGKFAIMLLFLCFWIQVDPPFPLFFIPSFTT